MFSNFFGLRRVLESPILFIGGILFLVCAGVFGIYRAWPTLTRIETAPPEPEYSPVMKPLTAAQVHSAALQMAGGIFILPALWLFIEVTSLFWRGVKYLRDRQWRPVQAETFAGGNE